MSSNHHDTKLDLKQKGDAVLLPVKALPGSRRNGITGIHDGALKVAVTQVAEKGKANQAIRKLLARDFGISASSVSLESGDISSRKLFAMTGITCDQLLESIERILSSNKS